MCLLAWMDVRWRAATSTASAFPICVFLCLIFVESVLVILAIWLILIPLACVLGFYRFSASFYLPDSVCPPVGDLFAISTGITELIFFIWFVCLYTPGAVHSEGLSQILHVAGIPLLVRFLDANVLPHFLFFVYTSSVWHGMHKVNKANRSIVLLLFHVTYLRPHLLKHRLRNVR